MPFTVPNTASAAFPSQASLDSGDLTILAAGPGLTGVISGCVVTAQGTPNMTVAVAAGVVRIGGRRVTAAGGNVTITTANGTNPRHDLITVDTSGALAAVAGTPAVVTTTSEPVFPAIPANRAVLAAVYVPAADTAVDSNQITDKRVVIADPAVEDIRWYGAVGDGVTDDTAAIQAAITVAAARGQLTPYLQTPAGTALFRGGGVVYVPTATFVHTGLTLGNRVTIQGDGWGSILRLKAGSNAHSITNAPHAIMCGVRNVRVDGNAAGQATTTVAVGSNGAASTAATLNVTSTAAFPAAGSLVVYAADAGPQQIDYTGKTATTFTGCTSTGVGNGNGTFATGAVVQPLVHGIYWNFVTTPDATLDEDFDGNYLCDHTFVLNATADAYVTNGRGSTHIHDCKAYMSGRNGFRFDQDVIASNIDTGWSGGNGVVVLGAGGGISNSKAWYAGRVQGSATWSGWVAGFAIYYCNNTILNGCSAQDNSQHGLYAEGTSGLMVNGFVADSNGAGGQNGVGISLWATARSLIWASAMDNNRQALRQNYGLALGGGNTGSRIIMTSTGNTGGNIDAATVASELTNNSVTFNAANPAQTATIRSDNYLLYASGGITYAVNGVTGAVDYSGADAGAVLQSVITALGTGGGTITFKAGSYTWSSVPALRPNTTGWVKLIAEPGTTIALSTAGSRFLDFGRLADGDTFRYIHIEGFTVDAAALSAFNQSQHIVIGTWAGSAGVVSGNNVNLDHITIRRIRTLNVRMDTTDTVWHLNVWLSVYQTSAATQRTIKNILVEDCEFNGGTYGVAITGNSNGLGTTNPNIYMDNIVVRGIYHDTGIVPANFTTSAHVHLGSGATGGTCWVERIYGRGSGDVGIEIDNVDTAYVRDVYIENYYGFGIDLTNFITPLNLKAQTFYVTNITGYQSWPTGSWSSDSCSLIGIPSSNDAAGSPVPIGRVVARNIRLFRKNSALQTAGVEGDLIIMLARLTELSVDGAQYVWSGLSWNGTGSPSPTVISTNNTAQRCRMSLRNVDIRLDGTVPAASAIVGLTYLYLGGSLDLLVDNLAIDSAVTNLATFSTHGIELGSAASSNISGTIRNYRFTSTDTGYRGAIVSGTSTLTIPSAIYFDDCDFTRSVSGGTEIQFNDTTVKAPKVIVRNIKWQANPKATYTLTIPATTVSGQYTDPWAATFSLTGGTVTVVQVSRNNSAFFQIAAGTNVSWQMFPGDYYKLTYSVAPTLTVIPAT